MPVRHSQLVITEMDIPESLKYVDATGFICRHWLRALLTILSKVVYDDLKYSQYFFTLFHSVFEELADISC